jgi:hypothetical protein
MGIFFKYHLIIYIKMPSADKKKPVVKKPKCVYCKGVKKTVKGGQSGGCGCGGMAAKPV